MMQAVKSPLIILARLIVPVAIMLSFQNGVDHWRTLQGVIGGAWVIVLFFAIFAGVFSLLLRYAKRSFKEIQLLHIGLWLGLLGFTLWLPDAAYVAKKIHVPEYILIAIATRWAFSLYVSSNLGLTQITLCIGVMIGVHDEVMQGLHPDRYFGYVDIGVNSLSVVLGAWLGHALMMFSGDENIAEDKASFSWREGLGAGFLISAVGLLLWTLWRYKGLDLPEWSIVPLALAGVSVLILNVRESLLSKAFVLSCVSLGGYVVLSHVLSLQFN